VVVCLASLFAGIGALHAQAGDGSIQGTVVDPRGQAVQGATVVVASASAVERTAATAADGKFVINSIAPGTYTLAISSTGFATQVKHGVVVTAGASATVPVSLVVASVSEEVTVEAEGDPSIAAQQAPMKALLDEASPRTEISSAFIRNYTSPVTDFSDITQAAPGTVSFSTNGVGMGQAKTWFRGFSDGNYSMTWDGVPFQDSNDPTHHSWAYVPAPAISYVDFDRSPGTASDIGPANFGGSIHMFSPKMGDAMTIKGSESYGSFNTNQFLGEFNSGLFANKLHFWLEGHHMTSDGYQTNNFQVRTAATAKLDIRATEKTSLTFVGTSVLVDSNTPNNDPTRRQILHHGDNYLLDHNLYNPDGSANANYYRFYTYHVPTNFEIATFNTELGHGWKFDNKAYTYSYSNHQHYQNDQTSDLVTDAANPKPIQAAVTATSAINKLNQYNRIGNIASFSQASKYGVLRAGGWYEFTTTNRYQIGSNPMNWVDSPNLKDLKFHEHFITQSFHPFVEYQLVAIPRWTITAGLKDAFFQMHLKQYADGKTVGNLGCAGKTIAACAGVAAVHTANYNSWLPSAQANFRVKSNWSVYGDYGRGSVIPPSSIFDTTGAQVAVTPEPTVADTIQGGTVLKLNRLMMDADVFHIHYQNAYSSYTDSTGFTFYYQSPASNTTGFEFESTVALPHGLNFVSNSTLGQAKYVAASASTLANGTVVAAAPSAWVAKAPKDTESLGVTFQNRSLDMGFFNKRIGERWDDAGGGFHQNIDYDPFWMNNLFFNYTLRKNSLFDQSKIKLSMNNLFDYHDAVGISPVAKATGTNVPYVQGPNDQLQLLPGRSVMVTFQIGLMPRER
jgi:iron complex outermembrane receptor protein